MAQPSDVNVDDLRRRARRRLVGAIVLALSAAVFVPMLLESEPKPLGEDVSVKIPPVDNGKFVNKLNAKGGGDPAKASAKGEAARAETPKPEAAKAEATKAEPAPADSAPMSSVNPSPGGAPAMPAAGSGAAPDAAMAPRRSLAEAEQKVLAGPAKPATALTPPVAKAPAAAVAAPDAAPAVASTAKAPVSLPATGTDAAKAEAPKAAADTPGFSVQLAAFSDDKGANALVNKLKKLGYVAYTEPLTTASGTKLWRVRAGPVATRDAAGALRDKLKADGYSGIVAPAK